MNGGLAAGPTYMVILGAVLIAVCAGGALTEWWLRRNGELPDAFTPEERARYRATLRGDYPEGEPTDDEIYNGLGREGGIAYDPADEPGSLGENDWRL